MNYDNNILGGKMTFQEQRRKQARVFSLGQKFREGKVKKESNSDLFVNGPEIFDCLVHKWSRKELLGVIGDSGVGKSEVVLFMIKSMLESNPDSHAVYVSLEMTDQEIAKRWFDMTQDNMDLADRLFILSRYDENGKSADVSMNWIQRELERYSGVIGDICCFTVDHIHVVGENDHFTLNSIMVKLKEMAVELNALGIPMAQVNKSSGKKGEAPLDADSVLGCSQFKYISNNIIQIHRPILRLEEDAKLSFLSWSYCKIRETHKNDKVKRGKNKLLLYDREKRILRKPDTYEYEVFKRYYNTMLDLRKNEENNNQYAYSIEEEVQDKDGRIRKVDKMFSGTINNDNGYD